MNIFEPVQDDASDRGPDPTGCLCPTPDDQYLMEIDCGSVYFKHAACGKPPGEWVDEAFSMQPVAVTLRWTQDTDYWTGEVDGYGAITVNEIPQATPPLPAAPLCSCTFRPKLTLSACPTCGHGPHVRGLCSSKPPRDPAA